MWLQRVGFTLALKLSCLIRYIAQGGLGALRKIAGKIAEPAAKNGEHADAAAAKSSTAAGAKASQSSKAVPDTRTNSITQQASAQLNNLKQSSGTNVVTEGFDEIAKKIKSKKDKKAANPSKIDPNLPLPQVREALWEKYITKAEKIDQSSLEALMSEAQTLEKRVRGEFVLDLMNRYRLARGGTAPDVGKGRGVFSDEDLELPISVDDMEGKVEDFMRYVRSKGKKIERKPLYLEIAELDILVWLPSALEDLFCDNFDAWKKNMVVMAADKEKSLVARAEALQSQNIPTNFKAELMEVVLEGISKARDYIKPGVFENPNTFKTYGKLFELAKSDYRTMNAAGLVSQRQLMAPAKLQQIAKMRASPSEMGLADASGKFSSSNAKSFLEEFQGLSRGAFALSLARSTNLLNEKWDLFKKGVELHSNVNQIQLPPRPFSTEPGTKGGKPVQSRDPKAMLEFIQSVHRCEARLDAMQHLPLNADVYSNSRKTVKNIIDSIDKKFIKSLCENQSPLKRRPRRSGMI